MIHIIIPYFGQFPNYFQLYLDSVANNTDILHVIFITDINTTKYNFPSNTTIINKSFEDVRRLIYKLLLQEFTIPIEYDNFLKTPYKLTDFKPLQPKFFQCWLPSIPSTDYIGWGDCDVILGKLSNFINISRQPSLIGRHGHFTVFRNIEPYLSLYKQIDQLIPRLMDERTMYIDEHQWAAAAVLTTQKNNQLFCDISQTICDIIPWQWITHKELTMTTKPETIIQYLVYDATNGHLHIEFNDTTKQETPYVHLQKRAMTLTFDDYLGKFYIHKDSFDLFPTI